MGLRDSVSRKFPDSLYISLGGQFFLRFLCPAITAPHIYGLMESPPESGAQRYLVLMSKIMQVKTIENNQNFNKKHPRKTSDQDLFFLIFIRIWRTIHYLVKKKNICKK